MFMTMPLSLVGPKVGRCHATVFAAVVYHHEQLLFMPGHHVSLFPFSSTATVFAL